MAIKAFCSSEKTCMVCGKSFYTSNPSGYVYKLFSKKLKNKTDWFCCYTCYRKEQKKREKRRYKRG